MAILTKTGAFSSFLLEPFQFIFEKCFNFFGKIVFEVDKMCYH